MKKLISLIVVLGAIGAATWWYIKYGTPEVKPQVTESGVTRGFILEGVQATGTLMAERTVDIGTQVSGTVKTLYVDFNSIVKKNQLLAELDPTLLQTQVDMQEANLKRSEVDISQRRLTLENDIKKLERQRGLFDKQLVTREALDQSELQVKMDQASLDSSLASKTQTEATLNQAKTNVSYTKIYAPVDGVITVRNTDQGRTVNASTSSPTLYTMATDLSRMLLTASIDEAEVSKVRQGQPVTFRVDTYAGSVFRGIVKQVRLNAKNTQNVVTYETVIDVSNADLRLKPGMTATLTIEVQRVEDVLKIPAAALRFRPTAEMFGLLKQPIPPEAQPGGGRGAAGMAGGRGERNAPDAGAASTPDRGATSAPGAAGAKDAAASKGTDAPKDAAAGASQSGRQRSQSGIQAGGDASARSGQDARTGGRGGQGDGRGGFTMTPEQRKQVDAITAKNLSPEARRAEMAKIFGNMGGRGGQNSGRQGAPAPGATTNMAQRGADTIDDLLPPVQRQETPNQRVWVFVNNQLKPISGIRTGTTDGQFTEMVTGDLKEGDKVITNFIIPGAKVTPTQQQQGNPFQPQQGRGGGGRGGRG